MFEFSQSISRQDHLEAQALLRRRLHGPAIISFIIFSLLIPYGAAVLVASFGRLYFIFMMAGQDLTFRGALVLALISIVTYWVFRDVGQYLWRRFVLPPPITGTHRKILINDEGIEIKTPTGVAFSNWHGDTDLMKGRHGLMIMISPYDGLYLPNRLFETHEQKAELIAFVEVRLS